MIRLWLCLRLPWHRWSFVRPLSIVSDLHRCSCGRLYAINNDIQAVLPFERVRAFYEASAFKAMSGGRPLS